MNVKKFLWLTLLQFIVMVPVRVYFLSHQIFADPVVQAWVFWLVIIIISAAFVRRMGPLNLLESFFVTFIWLVGGLLLDLVATSGFTGMGIFTEQQYWAGYVVMIVTIFICHKKLHIHRRHELHAKKHAAAHAHTHGNTHQPAHGHEKKH